MVDPNRKINRFTEKDIEFLEECEQEFNLRFTEDDVEFMEHCSKPLSDPPILENWNTTGGNFSPREGGGKRYNRNWSGKFGQRRGGRHGFNQQPYSHMKVSRDYSNFVAASKND